MTIALLYSHIIPKCDSFRTKPEKQINTDNYRNTFEHLVLTADSRTTQPIFLQLQNHFFHHHYME